MSVFRYVADFCIFT